MSRPAAIVTGAGSGIGRATAVLLAGEGYDLVLVGRRAELLESVAEEARAAGARTEVYAGDVGNRETAYGMVDRCAEAFGRVDALVNNAGVAALRGIDKTDPEVLEQAFRVNALGPAWAISRAWPRFVAQRRGVIVNVSTMGTRDPFPGFFAYAASKASVNLMAKSCAKEGARLGIKAFAVAPGAVETPLLRSLFPATAVPASACMAPDEVAKVIVDCVQGRREADNGETIFLSKR